MSETKGHGSKTAKKANAAASKEGKSNPREQQGSVDPGQEGRRGQ